MAVEDQCTFDQGFTDVCYDESGKTLLACGSIPDIAFRKDEGKTEFASFVSLGGERFYAISGKLGTFFIGGESHAVHTFKPNGENTEPGDQISSFGSDDVNCIAVNSKCTAVAVGSSNHAIRLHICATEDGVWTEIGSTLLQGHQASVFSVQIDPTDKYIASSAGDGSVKIWEINIGDVNKSACVKTLPNLFPKSTILSNAKQLGRGSFQPKTGEVLAIPCSSEIRLFQRDSWLVVGNLSLGNKSPSVAAFHSNGLHIAAGYTDGTIAVFEFNSRSLVKSFPTLADGVTAIVWNPMKGSTELAFGSFDGVVRKIASAFSIGVKPVASFAVPVAAASSSRAKSVLDAKSDLGCEDLDDLNDFDDLLPDDLSDTVRPPVRDYAPAISKPRCTRQPAFQPGSTPFVLESSFMVFNEVGCIKKYKDKATNDSEAIDVTFHDASHHHSIHIYNRENYTIGCMNSTAYLLASTLPDPDVKDSKCSVALYLVSSYDKTKHWSLDMDDGELIEGIALGEEICYVATSKRIVRVISHSGFQMYVISVPGPFVCMTARAQLLMFVYHQHDPTDSGSCPNIPHDENAA